MMEIELRKTGISVVGDVPWGTHFCHFYETKEDLLNILIPYFKTGLENNEFCVWVVSDPLGEKEARNAFRQAVSEADRYLAAGHIQIVPHTVFLSRQQTSPTGRIEIVPYTDWYLKGGFFIAERVIGGWNEKLAEALARGHAGLRANGNEAWLTEENRKDFLQYEKTLDQELAGQRMIVLCSYPLTSSSAAQIFDVVNTHQLAVVRRRGNWEVLETPELKQAKQEIKRLNEELEQRVIERTNELRVANEQLRKEIIERKRAEEKLKATSEQLRALSARLQSVKEEDAARIAREIHDELGSALAALKWDLELIEKDLNQEEGGEGPSKVRVKIAAMKEVIDDTINAIRRISAELRPSALDDLGLVAAIRWHAREFEERTGIVTHFDSSLEDIDLTQQQSTAVFRIFEEAMTNVMRHAQATLVEIKLEKENGELLLTIQDNGRGITADEKSDQLSLGLLGMRERAKLVGGQVDIANSEGNGTVVTVSLPVA